MMIQQIQLDFLRYEIEQLRLLDFFFAYADIPDDVQPRYDEIYDQAETRAWVVTEKLLPRSTKVALDTSGLVVVNGQRCALLSEFWWQQIDDALAEL